MKIVQGSYSQSRRMVNKEDILGQREVREMALVRMMPVKPVERMGASLLAGLVVREVGSLRIHCWLHWAVQASRVADS